MERRVEMCPKICPKHRTPMYRFFGDTRWYCNKCEAEQAANETLEKVRDILSEVKGE